MAGGWLKPRTGRFTRGKATWYPLYRRLGGPQGPSERARKKSILISPVAFQPSSPYVVATTSAFFPGRYKTESLKCVQILLVMCGVIDCYINCWQVYALTWHLLVFLTTAAAGALSGFGPDKDGQCSDHDEEGARKHLEYLEDEINRVANIASLARWAYASNITEENLKNQVRKYGKFTVCC